MIRFMKLIPTNIPCFITLYEINKIFPFNL